MNQLIDFEERKQHCERQELAVMALHGVLDRIDSALDHATIAGFNPSVRSAIASLATCRDKIATEIGNLKRQRNTRSFQTHR